MLPVALGIGLVYYFYRQFTIDQLTQMKLHFQQANYWFLLLSASLSVISHMIRTHRWHLLLAPLNHFPKWYNSFFAVCVAYFMNLFIPKSGELSRALTLNQYESVPVHKGLGTIITERIIDLFFLIAFFILAISMNYSVLIDYLSTVIPVKKLMSIIVSIILGVIFFIMWIKNSNKAIARKIKCFLKEILIGILSITKVKWPRIFILESLLIWLLYVASFYAATFAIAEKMNIGWEVIIITFVVGSFTFAFTNSGVGYYPLAVAGILSLFGIDQLVGNAFGWLIWIANISSIMFFGFIALLILPIVNKK